MDQENFASITNKTSDETDKECREMAMENGCQFNLSICRKRKGSDASLDIVDNKKNFNVISKKEGINEESEAENFSNYECCSKQDKDGKDLDRYFSTKDFENIGSRNIIITKHNERLSSDQEDFIHQNVRYAFQNTTYPKLFSIRYNKPITFVLRSGFISCGEHEKYGDVNTPFKSLNEKIYFMDSKSIPLGFQSLFEKVVEAAADVANNDKVKTLLKQKCKRLKEKNENILSGLGREKVSFPRISLKMDKCTHQICIDTWTKSLSTVVQHLRAHCTPDVVVPCLFLKKLVKNIQSEEDIEEGYHCMPAQFHESQEKQQRGVAFKYDLFQLKYNDLERVIDKCIGNPVYEKTYSTGTKKFKTLHVVYLVASVTGFYFDEDCDILRCKPHDILATDKDFPKTLDLLFDMDLESPDDLFIKDD